MNVGAIGYIVGASLFASVVPVIILIVLKLIPATRNRHGLAYGIAGAVAVLTTRLLPDATYATICTFVVIAIFGLGYLRARRSKPIVKPTP